MRKQSTLILLVLLSTNWLLAQIPAGYYTSADGLAGASLKTALFNIIKGHTQVSYTPGVWNAFYTTDKKANGKVWDMYSDVPGGTLPYEYSFGTNQCGSYSGEGSCYNREHSFPKSWFGDVAPMNVDIFHLYPTDGYVNGKRSNYPYGTVSSPTWTSKNGSKLGPCSAEGYTGTVFEPINEYKGDFARTYFYMVTRYQDVVVSWYSNTEAKPVLNATTYPCFNPWFLKLLLAWNAADPVSPKEISRNDAVYAIQHNRNPFIDHPEYVTAIWGGTTILSQPTNHVLAFTISAKTSSSITLTWNDNDGSQPAGKFLILANTTGVFTSPSDGIAYADDINMSDNIGAINVNHGVQSYTWTGLTSNTTYYFMICPYTNTPTDADYKTDGTIPAVNGTTPLVALITVAPVALNGFSYVFGTGASASQSYLLSGVGLSPVAGNVNVTGTADFEVSTNNTIFNSSFALAYSNGTLESTPVYVRLKSGLAAGSYSSEKITNSGGSASIANISCSGNVTQAALLVATPASFLGFNYALGNGPSASQSFLLSGAGLIPATGNVTVTGSDNFEVSTDNSTFSGTITVPYTSGVLSLTTIYAWMKADLGAGTYSGENISISGGSATPLQIACTGNIVDYTNISNHSRIEGNIYVNHEYLYISVPEMEGKQAEIVIYNAMGQQIKRMKLGMLSIVRMESPSVPGIYIVRINAGTVFFSAKLIVGGN